MAFIHLRARPVDSIRRRKLPATLDILSRFAGVSLHPKFSSSDVDDVVAAIRKVYPQIVRG